MQENHSTTKEYGYSTVQIQVTTGDEKLSIYGTTRGTKFMELVQQYCTLDYPIERCIPVTRKTETVTHGRKWYETCETQDQILG